MLNDLTIQIEPVLDEARLHPLDSAHPGAQLVRPGQGREFFQRIRRVDVGIVGAADPGNRIQRQAQTDGRIAGNEEEAFLAQKPRTTCPGRPALRATAEGEHVTDDFLEALIEDSGQARAFFFFFEP